MRLCAIDNEQFACCAQPQQKKTKKTAGEKKPAAKSKPATKGATKDDEEQKYEVRFKPINIPFAINA